MLPTITFVTPWYGEQVTGGAENACRRTAEELCARGIPAEVFTTTAGGLMTEWTQAAFPTGQERINEVLVHRFPVRSRDAYRFDLLNQRLLRGERLSLLEEAVFVNQIIRSDALEAAIAAERDRRLWLFIPYMFGTTYWGARATDRAYLIPCLHDEPYSRMELYKQAIEGAHALLFLSPAEKALAERMFDLEHSRTLAWGTGVETTMQGDAQRFRARYGVDGPFVLYAGRRDPTKNTPLLLDYFSRYHAAGGELRLVCIGGPGEPLPPELTESGAAVDLGFLSPQDKYDAYAAATLLCQPSVNESFSLVMMEAWICGTPVLVHSDCAVTRSFCEASDGGLHFRNYDEWLGCVEWFHAHPATARRMGGAGGDYVREQFRWEAVIGRLLQFLRDDLQIA